MSEIDFDVMSKNKWYVTLIRTDSWDRLSDPVLIKSSEKTNTFI